MPDQQRPGKAISLPLEVGDEPGLRAEDALTGVRDVGGVVGVPIADVARTNLHSGRG